MSNDLTVRVYMQLLILQAVVELVSSDGTDRRIGMGVEV